VTTDRLDQELTGQFPFGRSTTDAHAGSSFLKQRTSMLLLLLIMMMVMHRLCCTVCFARTLVSLKEKNCHTNDDWSSYRYALSRGVFGATDNGL